MDHVAERFYALIMSATMQRASQHVPAPQAHSPTESQFDKLPLWRSFGFRLAMGLALLCAALIGSVGYLTFRQMQQSHASAFQQRLHTIALVLGQSLAPSVSSLLADEASSDYALQLQALNRRLQSIVDQEQDIESIYVLRPGADPSRLAFLCDVSRLTRPARRGDVDNMIALPLMLQGYYRVVVEERDSSRGAGRVRSSYAPLRDQQGRVIGIVGLDVTEQDMAHLSARVASLCFAVFGAALAIMLFICFWVGRQIRRPLSQVLRAASDISRGRLDSPLETSREDEFGLLARRFSVMASNLRDRERLREAFGLYISPELASNLIGKGGEPALGGTECVATVLFVDVQGFTRISESLSAADTIFMLNNFLGAMVDLIREHDGCALDMIGDGVIGVFGAPIHQPDHAENAVRCALAMEKRMASLNADWSTRGLAVHWRRAGIEQVQIRIGLHTGMVVAGNIGSTTRMKYSVIGDTVNIASRLETLNKTLGTSILLSEDLRRRLPPPLAASLVDRGVVPVRGRQQSVRVFSTR